MKKIYLFLILSLQGLFIMAQSILTIDLDKQNIADVLTPEAQGTLVYLTLKGHMSNEDYPYVNECKKLVKLDMTNVITDSIPRYSLAKNKPLANFYLPKKKILFNENAVVNYHSGGNRIVTVHVTGDFPELGLIKKDERLNEKVYFTIEKNNSRYIETEDRIIYSADRDTLIYFGTSFGYWSDVAEKGLNHFDVKVIAPYAFVNRCIESGISMTFSNRLELISQHAFEGIHWDYIISSAASRWGTEYWPDLAVYLGERPPQIDGPVFWNTFDYWMENGRLEFVVPNMHTYLENSCLWAGTDMIPQSFTWLYSYNDKEYPYYDKDHHVLQYAAPHIINTDWYLGMLNVKDVEFASQREGTDSIITANIDLEFSPYFMFIISWTDIDWDFGSYYHNVEYRDTIYSPISDWEDLIYDIEIVDDEGNVVFSSRRKGGKGSTEHVSGVLTNVPQSQQGDLKSRTSGMRYGESPWKSQRVNFGATGIALPQLSPEGKGGWFDLTGRPVDGTQKGILIRNGKKVLIR